MGLSAKHAAAQVACAQVGAQQILAVEAGVECQLQVVIERGGIGQRRGAGVRGRPVNSFCARVTVLAAVLTAETEKALAPTTNVACPLSFVVVENRVASSSPTLFAAWDASGAARPRTMSVERRGSMEESLQSTAGLATCSNESAMSPPTHEY